MAREPKTMIKAARRVGWGAVFCHMDLNTDQLIYAFVILVRSLPEPESRSKSLCPILPFANLPIHWPCLDDICWPGFVQAVPDIFYHPPEVCSPTFPTR